MRKPFPITVVSVPFALLHLVCLAAGGLRVVRNIRPCPASTRT
jgi:hypothetical protein